jgi:oxazoline/thiazoline synthase
MDRVLRFKHHLRPVRVDDGLVLLLGEREQFLLQGRSYALLAPLIDGRRSVLELIQQLSQEAPPTDIYYAISQLDRRGYLVEVADEISPEVAAFWHALGIDAALATSRLRDTPVAVQALGSEDAAELAGALVDAGVELRDDAPTRIFVTGDYLDPSLDAWNREAREKRVRWTLVKPAGPAAFIGPLFRPDQGPCWDCLSHRLRENRPAEAFIRRRSGARGPLTPPRAATRASVGAALRFAAMTLARWIAEGERGIIDDHLLTLEIAAPRVDTHAVLRRPECATCGDRGLGQRRMLEPVVLASRPKRFTDDGGHRIASPEETLARLLPRLSPVTGVLSSSGPVEGLDHPLRPVYGASYAVCPSEGAPTVEAFQRRANGKGRTPVQAHVSALCEAIERYSAIWQGDEPSRRARRADLGDEGVPPSALLNFSEAQYRARDAWNARIKDPSHQIPLPFDESVEIDWTPAWSLTHSLRRYLPTAYCYVDPPTPSERRFFCYNSNGHAAGNCLEEAILQGFLELVERDAFAIWWYNRVRRPGVALQRFEEPYFVELEAHYRAMGFRVWVLDITSDLEIPTFVALARHEENGRFSVGFGCHLEARLGVQRALTELNQLFDPRGDGPTPWDPAELEEASFLYPDADLPPRAEGDFPELWGDDLRGDVATCVRRAARSGLETIVLDQTRPDTGLHVVKVAVPGLRHFRPQLAPGRLYDVPVRLGWRARPETEASLNRALLFPT